jgi:anti-sigma factor RsiW
VNCSACNARLGAYRDGELSARESALVEAHLASCGACRSFAARYAAVEASLDKLVGIEPSPDFTIAVMAKIAALAAPAPRPVRFWWLVAADIAIWVAIGALTAIGTIRWKTVLATVSATAAKLGVTFDTLYTVGQHFHITTIVALGVLVELGFLALIVVLGRKYFERVRSALAGVLS